MDQKKKQSITGLIVGFILLIFLWWFRFDRWEFVNIYRPLFSPMGELIFGITKNIMTDVFSAERNRAENFWYITQLIYIGAVWYCRSCVGFWFLKIIKSGYKKI